MQLKETTMQRLKRMGKIGIQVKYAAKNGKWYIDIKQNTIPTLQILTHRRLEDIALDIFQDEDRKLLRINTEVYKFDSAEIDYRWIRNKMQDLNVSNQDLIEHLQLDGATVSTLINGKRELSKGMKNSFYYYFLYLELWQGIRKQMGS